MLDSSFSPTAENARPAGAAGFGAAPGSSTATYKITYIYNDPAVPQDARDQLSQTMDAVMQYILGHVAGKGSIDIEITVAAGGSFAAASSVTNTFVGKAPDGKDMFMPGVAAELLSGTDPNGTTPDARITINSRALMGFSDSGWFDPTPFDRTDPMPSNKLGMFETLLHEMLHTLAFNGFRDQSVVVGGFPTGESPYDSQTIVSNGKLYFNGPAALAVHNGTPIELETEHTSSLYYHIALSEGNDVINLIAPIGVRSEWSKLDLAILHDSGLSLINAPTAGADYFFGDDVAETLSPGAGDDFIMGFGGDDTIDGGTGTNTAAFRGTLAQYKISTAGGTVTISDTVAGRDGTDRVTNVQNFRFSDKAVSLSTLIADAPNSTGGKSFATTSGNDTIAGTSTGRDTLLETGTRSSWTVTKNGDGSFDLKSTAGGTDHLTGIERIAFSDGVLIGDAGANGSVAYRLYQAAFARVPDEAGLMVQSKLGLDPMVAAQAAAGHDNVKAWGVANTEAQYFAAIQLAQNFLGSAEFIGKYGANPTNEDFVTLLYRNVLGRSPDSAGLTNQVNALNNGTSRATLLVNFSESAENVQLTGANTANGLLWSSFPDTTI